MAGLGIDKIIKDNFDAAKANQYGQFMGQGTPARQQGVGMTDMMNWMGGPNQIQPQAPAPQQSPVPQFGLPPWLQTYMMMR